MTKLLDQLTNDANKSSLYLLLAKQILLKMPLLKLYRKQNQRFLCLDNFLAVFHPLQLISKRLINDLSKTIVLFTCLVHVGPKPTGFLHHNQIFDVVIEKNEYDIKNFIVQRKSAGFWPLKLNMWTGYARAYHTIMSANYSVLKAEPN